MGHSELQHQGMAQVEMFQGQLDIEIMEGCKESVTEIKMYMDGSWRYCYINIKR